MMDDLRFVTLLFAPLGVGSLLHGLVTYRQWLPGLRAPIDGGVRLGGQPLFGPSKTWRGVLSVATGTALGYALAATGSDLTIPELAGKSPALAALFGFDFGAGAMLGELPNSFIKRRLGWPSGTSPRGLVGVLWYVVDQVDLVLGCWVVAVLVAPISASRVLISCQLGRGLSNHRRNRRCRTCSGRGPAPALRSPTRCVRRRGSRATRWIRPPRRPISSPPWGDLPEDALAGHGVRSMFLRYDSPVQICNLRLFGIRPGLAACLE